MRYFRLSLHSPCSLHCFFSLRVRQRNSPLYGRMRHFKGVRKVLVINTFPNPASRRLFEDEFVKALKDRRVDAVVSYNVMPDPVVDDKEAIAGQANSVGADSVLINRPIGATTHENTAIYGVTYGDLYVNTQTNFYDMKLNRVVLSTTAETVIPQGESYPSHIQSYVIDLVNKLSQAGLF